MSNLGPNFYPKLLSICSELGMKPEDLLNVMVSESSLNPSAAEATYNGGGLLGFMPSTLKGLHFNGSPEDFRKLSGEQQLDWVKKLVQGYMVFNGGKPFDSAVQYYIANFIPTALKLPGIQAKKNSYAFLEEHPATIKDPKTGELLSKKYYDIGVNLRASQESLFYKANPAFHGSTAGAITYGDMLKTVNKNRRSQLYGQALQNMKAATGYEPVKSNSTTTEVADSSGSVASTFWEKLKTMMHMFSLATQEQNTFLIAIASSSDRAAKLEYAAVLSSAMEDYFAAKTSIHHQDESVEICCQIPGESKIIYAALNELCCGVSDAFSHATKKIGSIQTNALIAIGNKSLFPIVKASTADLYHLRFKMQFGGK